MPRRTRVTRNATRGRIHTDESRRIAISVASERTGPQTDGLRARPMIRLLRKLAKHRRDLSAADV